jgi:GMP synthase-like glutamine amidotransferase
MKLIEFVHDTDHPLLESNIDLYVERHADVSTHRISAYRTESYPDLSEFDLLLIHGGAQHLWAMENDPWLFDEVAFVKKAIHAGKPVIGFCLGSQILAEALDSRVFKADISEHGFYDLHIHPDSNKLITAGLKEPFSSFLWHGDHFDLPAGCECAAYTKAAPNQIFYSCKMPVIGYQFHPEYTKDIIAYGAELYPGQKWRSDCKSTDAVDKDAFLQSLESADDTYPLFGLLFDNALSFFKESF